MPPPLPLWHRGSLREVLAFGLPASGAGLTYVAITNSTLAVAAIRLTASQVGLFWRAFQLGVIYQEKISGIMVRLAFPVYSRTNDLDELRRFHERATRIHAAVLLPLLALLAVTAPDLVPWLFGERWAPAATPVQVLCVAGMIAADPHRLPADHARRRQAAGAADLQRRPARALHRDLLVRRPLRDHRPRFRGRRRPRLPPLRRLRRPLPAGPEIPVRRLVTDLLPAVASSLLLLAAAVPAAELMRSLEAPVPVLLAAVGIVGALVYMGALRSLFPVVWADVAQLTRRVLPAPSNALAALRPRRTAERAIGGA